MSYSNDELHAATLQVLREVADYMLRLPPVPVTTAMCKRIEEHLADPVNQLVSANNEFAGRVYEGAQYTPSGLPLVAARVVFPTEVSIWAEKPSQAAAKEKHAKALLSQLFSGGIRLDLHRVTEGKPYPRFRPGQR